MSALPLLPVRVLLAAVATVASVATGLGAQPPADTTRRPALPDTGARPVVDSVPPPLDSVLVPTAPTAPALPVAAAPAPDADASWLAPERVRAPIRLPVAGGEGPRVLHVQVLLGAAGFSPGVLDGRWQAGTRAAVRAFREAHQLGEGTAVDEATYDRLLEASGRRPPVVAYRLTYADVRGPLRKIPAGYPAKARLDCLCYETVGERVAERFHTTPAILRALNPGLALDSAGVGREIAVPNVWRLPPKAPPARLVIDKRGGTLRGYADDGALLFSLRASVGSAQTPSPTGRLRVLSVTRNPWYAYDPRVLSGDSRTRGSTADLPPGPNSPVGLVWIQLSKAHIGIHGTPEPARVGSGQSHGCVRLTNWDALFLAATLTKGTAVEFQ